MAAHANLSPPELHVLATQLSQRIVETERRFATLPKKCEHSVTDRLDGCVSQDEVGPYEQGVGFKKDGRVWKLFFVELGHSVRDPTPEEEWEDRHDYLRRGHLHKYREHYQTWRELSQVSLIDKSKAVSLLRRLFEEMQEQYDRRTTLVSEALRTLDELDDQLPPVAKGGE